MGREGLGRCSSDSIFCLSKGDGHLFELSLFSDGLSKNARYGNSDDKSSKLANFGVGFFRSGHPGVDDVCGDSLCSPYKADGNPGA